MLIQRRYHFESRCTGQQEFNGGFGRVYASSGYQRALNPARKQSHPAQHMRIFSRVAQHIFGVGFEFININIGVKRAVKQHQSAYACFRKFNGGGGQAREIIPHFKRNWYAYLFQYGFNNIEIYFFVFGGVFGGVRRQHIHIQFKRIGAGFLYAACKIMPVVRRGTVNAGNYRYVDRLFGISYKREVFAQGKVLGMIGQVRVGFFVIIFPFAEYRLVTLVKRVAVFFG